MTPEERALAVSLRSAIAAYEAKLGVLRQALAIAEGRDVADAPTAPPARRGKEGSTVTMILEVMDSDPDRRWTSADVYNVLVERGWQTGRQRDPVNSVRTALARLAQRHAVRRVGDGEYQSLGAATDTPEPLATAHPPDGERRVVSSIGGHVPEVRFAQ